MTSTRDLEQLAWEHSIFPLIQIEELRKRGPMIWTEGEGVGLSDIDGNSYLDMMGSHTRANSLGYGNEEIARAVYEQLRTLHYVGTVANLAEPTIELSAKIASLAPGRLSRIVYVSGGSEAVEAAIKLARQYHIATGRKPRAHKIIARWNAYHGATMGALAATDWLGTRHISEPGVPGYSHIPGPAHYRNPFGMTGDDFADFCATYLEQQILHEGPDYVAAFIGEPIMQAHGVQMPPARYWQRAREICDKYDVLLIADEVITGFGRTGKWFAMEHFGVEPDIMTMAKALTAGYLPMGAVITRPEIADTLPIFRHVHTFSGHAAAAAAALKAIEIKERDGLVEKAARDGEWFQTQLQELLLDKPIVGDVRGIGMWHVIDFTSDKNTKASFDDDTVPSIVRRIQDKGMLVCAIGPSALEMAPPLIVTREQLTHAAEIIAAAIDEITAERGIG